MGQRIGLLTRLEQRIPHLVGFFTTRTVLWAIIAGGAILRLAQFLYNRSFTEGEAPLAINIINHSYNELLRPLNFVQPVPVGFSVIEKFFFEILGNSEYAFRIFPLIAGIVALFLFYKIVKKTISSTAAPIALILFAGGDHLIYFSSELKQYSSDLAVTLLLTIIALSLLDRRDNRLYLLFFGLISAVSLWFSHPAVFTSAAVFLIYLLVMIREKKWRELPWWTVAGLLVIISLAVNYSFILERLSANKDLLEGFQGSFMPLPPKSLKDLWWCGYVFLRIFKNPLGLSIYELILAVFSFLAGIVVLFRRQKRHLLLLILPILLTLLASGLRKYPFEGRLLLFTAPLMYIIIAQGLDYIRIKTAAGSQAIGLGLVLMILVQPVALAFCHLIRPRAPEELRPAVQYLKTNLRERDVIYVYYAASKAYPYYADRFDLGDRDYWVGIEARYAWDEYYRDLARFKGNDRFWILFSHITTAYGVDEENLLLSYLDLLGQRIDGFEGSGASIYLYDLSGVEK